MLYKELFILKARTQRSARPERHWQLERHQDTILTVKGSGKMFRGRRSSRAKRTTVSAAVMLASLVEEGIGHEPAGMAALVAT